MLAREEVEVESVLCRVLPQPRWSPRRGIAAAQLRVGGGPIAVASCHLGLAPERRLQEVEEVLAVADGLVGPVVVGGDLNEPAGGPCWRRLQDAGFVDHGSARWPTFPATRPAARIDALLVRGDVRVTHHGAVDVPLALLAQASDHLPVGAVIEV
ncbi:MAG: endonuclease/exonuclease/phosphatase family protein [Nocardioidaceae bacterium]